MATKKKTLSWSDVKTKLADHDRAALVGLVQDLYTVNKDNQAFLHARLALGGDVLQPYKDTLQRWLSPDLTKKQDVSVAKAKKAMAECRKAIGSTKELVELMVLYCELAGGFANEFGFGDEGYLDALVRMFEQALKAIAALPDADRPVFWARLVVVQRHTRDIGYGVGDDLEDLLEEYGAGG